jgi:hypothetical protein
MSSTKRLLAPYLAISAGDLSQASITSVAVDTSYLDKLTLQFNCTGSPTGSFAVQVSLDKVNWFTLSIVPPLNLTGSAAVLGTVLDTYGWVWTRAVYTKTSGTGAVNMLIAGKAA